MASFLGADIEQVRMLGTELDKEADQLELITARLTARISSVAWTGPTAQRFTSEWNDHLANTMRAVAAGMRSASAQASQAARQQEEASGGGGGDSTTALAGTGVLAATAPSVVTADAGAASLDALSDLQTVGDDGSDSHADAETRTRPRRVEPPRS